MSARPERPRPSSFGRRLLRWAGRRLDTPELEESVLELFDRRRERDGERVARRWYRRQLRMAAWRGAVATLPASGGARGPGLLGELGPAARRIRRRPAHALTFAAVVGVGIAVAAFMAQTRTDLLSPDQGVPVDARIVTWVDPQNQALELIPLTGAEAWLDDVPASLETVAAIWSVRDIVETPTGLYQAGGRRVLPGHLARLGVSAWMGRDLERPGEVVLAHPFWATRFEGSPDVIGRTVEFSGEPVTVVGIAPASFYGPLCCVGPSYWRVAEPTDEPLRARLAAVASRDDDATEAWLARVAESAAGPVAPELDHPAAHPFGGERGTVARVLTVLVLLAAVVWITTLLSGANLMVSDALSRASELRVRAALGARKSHLLVRVFAETGWLAAIAAAFAVVATGLMTWIAPWLLPMVDEVSIVKVEVGAHAVGIAGVAAALSAIVCALPAGVVGLRLASRASVQRGPLRSRFAAVGLGVQVALAGAMLLVTGLFVTVLRNYDGDFVGFRNGGAAVHFVTAVDRGAAPAGPVILEALRADAPGLPVALTESVPVYGAVVDSMTFPDGAREGVWRERVSPSFFEVIGTELIHGVPASSTGEAVISEDLAARMGGPAAIGATVVVTDTVALRVVGIVEAATWGSGDHRPTVYRGWGAEPLGRAVLVVGEGEAGSISRLLPALASVGVALEPFDTMRRLLVRRRVLEEFLTRLATAFGVAALLVALGAVHAHFVRWVRAREREMAIRGALGAPFQRIGRNVAASALRLVVPGAVLGTFLGWAAARGISAFMWELPVPGALLIVGVVGVLLVAALVALVVPLARVSRVDPLKLLRVD